MGSIAKEDLGYPVVHSLEHQESAVSVPHHPLGVRPSGNQYTASENARYAIGPFQIVPDEILAILLEYFESSSLLTYKLSICITDSNDSSLVRFRSTFGEH